MPLLQIKKITQDISLGIWEINEDIDALHELCKLHPETTNKLQQIRNIHRQKEILAVHALLTAMTHSTSLQIFHDEYGRPYLQNYNLSISHTKGYASIILSKDTHVAIDIEYPSNRVEKIANKFILSNEFAPTTLHKLINWCCKETTYKYFYKSRLKYNDMKVIFPQENNFHILKIENHKDKRQLMVNTIITSNYIITYAYKTPILLEEKSESIDDY